MDTAILPRPNIFDIAERYGVPKEHVADLSVLAMLAVKAAAPRAPRADERPTLTPPDLEGAFGDHERDARRP